VPEMMEADSMALSVQGQEHLPVFRGFFSYLAFKHCLSSAMSAILVMVRVAGLLGFRLRDGAFTMVCD